MANHPRTPDEITLRQLLLQSQEYLRYFFRYWYLPVIGGLLFAAFSYYQKKDVKPTYNAKIAALFRMDASAKNNAAIVQVFSKVAQSRLVAENTLFDKVNIGGKEDYFINHYLKIYQDTYPNFIPYQLPPDFSFTNNNILEFDELHRRVLNRIVKKITTQEADFSDGFIHASMEEKVGLLTINFSSPSEELSAFFVEYLAENLKGVYEEAVLYPKQEGFDILSQQIDSLRTEIKTNYAHLINYKKAKKDGKTYGSTRFLGTEIKTLEFDIEMGKRQLDNLQQQYAHASRELGQETPAIIVTERPVLPLEAYSPSRIWFIVKGLVIGIIAAMFFMLIFKIISDTLKE